MRKSRCRYLALAVLLVCACGNGDKSKKDGGSGGSFKDASHIDAGDYDGGKVSASETCGNGEKDDPAEECDDGNTDDSDGCTSWCEYTCHKDSDCDDLDPCNGSETCTSKHTCKSSGGLAEGEQCGDNMFCVSGVCTKQDECGDEVTQEDEECDDGNTDDSDGCTAQCRYTCVSDDTTRDCSRACYSDSCDDSTHTCTPGEQLPDGAYCKYKSGTCLNGKCIISIDAGPSDGGPNSVQPGHICDRLTTLQCIGEANCCDNPGRNIYSCKDTMMTTCTDELYIDKVSQNKIIGFDAGFAEEAFSTFEDMIKACNPSVASWGTSMQGLRGILKGTVDPGQSCKPAGALPTKEAYASALFSCKDGEHYACLPHQEGIEVIWTCGPPNALGGPCFTDINCVAGLYCDNPNMFFTGSVCKKRKDVGASCSLANECKSLMCKGGKCVAADRQAAYCLMET